MAIDPVTAGSLITWWCWISSGDIGGSLLGQRGGSHTSRTWGGVGPINYELPRRVRGTRPLSRWTVRPPCWLQPDLPANRRRPLRPTPTKSRSACPGWLIYATQAGGRKKLRTCESLFREHHGIPTGPRVPHPRRAGPVDDASRFPGMSGDVAVVCSHGSGFPCASSAAVSLDAAHRARGMDAGPQPG